MAQGHKSHDHPNRCRKGICQMLASIHDKDSQGKIWRWG